MAIGLHDEGNDDGMVNEINMTPFVDVMLVLLIVFMITIPVMHQSISINLPQAQVKQPDQEPEAMELSIDAQGQYVLDSQPLALTDLQAVLQQKAQQQPQPALRIHGDKDVRYEFVAQALAHAKSAGMQKVVFVTQPVHQ
ncbi:biopolymer transporter ExbD [Curvibacter sp. CHRR-16]|uniref:ExbD/TolR family protein n=1 Tax=Curvibacter sp. CHRR-16 TaxID=2835872 RepID=UPI001BD9F000|nr:biopolymer transporter ExbD [Curvibacter sp. CHRR-16]MBT0571157.1 biopolymer transporter ExbD [Curvibacter sp. CHRR-16]